MSSEESKPRLESESSALRSLEERARIAYEEGNYDVARSLMLSAIESKEADASTFYNLGQVLNLAGDYIGAIEAYGKAMDVIEDAFLNRGLCWEMVGDFDNARKDYLSALKADSNNVDALVNIGTLELDEGNLELAKRYLVQAVALDEKCNWQLADVYIEVGDLKMALEALERAVLAGESRAVSQLQEVREQLG